MSPAGRDSIRPVASLAMLLGLIAIHCGPEERIERYDLQAFVLEFADSLRSGVQDSILVGAQVGYEGCELESAAIVARSDSLFVSGMARCRVRIRDGQLLSPPQIANTPPRTNIQRLILPCPPLEPGRYVLVADALLDTILASPMPRSLPHSRIAARGSWFMLPSGCTVFEAFYAGLPYELVGTPTIGAPSTGRVYGIVEGESQCDSRLLELRVRRLEPD